MKNETDPKKKLRIYSIYFENPEYRSNSTQDPKITLNKIIELGGTDKIYESNSLPTLIKAFTDVSKAIQTNFKLYHSKKLI